MKPVVIFGTKAIAEIAHFYLETVGDREIAGFTANSDFIDSDLFKGLKVAPWEDLMQHFPVGEVELFIPISYTKVNAVRRARYEEGKALGYDFATFIHPAARYYGTPVGKNCFIFEDNVIQPFTEIGDNVILWSGNHIGHHSRIGNHAFISSHVVVSGNCTIGEQCFFGVNSTVHDNITLGVECVVSAGAIVAENLTDRTVLLPAQSTIARVPSNRLRNF